MTDKLRIKFAALVTAMFVAAVCAAGALTHAGSPTPVTVSQSRPVAQPAPALVSVPSQRNEQANND